MRRLVPVALVVVLVLAGAACSGTDDDAVLTVNGEEVLTTDEFQAQLDELAEDDDFLTASDGRGAGPGTLSTGFTSAVLSNHVLNAVVAEELAAEGVEVSDEDVAQGTDLLAQQVGGDVENIPPSYRAMLIDMFAGFFALTGALDGDQAAAQERANELLAEAEVEVARRYGRWDAATAQVAAPEGPITPTTEPVLVPAGG